MKTGDQVSKHNQTDRQTGDLECQLIGYLIPVIPPYPTWPRAAAAPVARETHHHQELTTVWQTGSLFNVFKLSIFHRFAFLMSFFCYRVINSCLEGLCNKSDVQKGGISNVINLLHKETK